MRPTLSKLAAFWQRRSLDARLEAETRTHLEMLAAEYERRGLSPDEARHAARRAFGGIEPMKEAHRDGRGFRWAETVVRDIRYAWRTALRNPGYATVVTAILAVGIGANTAVFSLIDAAMFRALPVTAPEHLVVIESTTLIPYPTFRDLRDTQRALSGVLATTGPQRMTLRWPDGTRQNIFGTEVSSEYFSVIGASLAAGRPFTADDERTGAASVVIISYDLWQRRFGGSAGALGQSVVANARSFAIIGVAARDFRGEVAAASSDAWMLISQVRSAADLENRRGSFFRMMGRLREAGDVAGAETALTSDLRRLAAVDRVSADAAPDDAPSNRQISIRLQPAGGGLTVLLERFELPLWLGLAFVALLLAVSCANLAGLSMVRAFAREGELGVRVALGATRGRLISQLLIENVTLSVAGGVVGLALAYAISRPLSTLLAGGLLPLTLDLAPNVRVIAFTAVVSLSSGALFGLAPALRSRAAYKPRGIGGGASRSERRRLTTVFVVGQVSVSVLLLVTAGVLAGSLRNMGDVDPGFSRENVLLVDIRSEGGQDGTLLGVRLAQLRERVGTLPGVRRVSASWLQVFEPFADMSAPLSIDGYTPPIGDRVLARYNVVSPGYFSTIGMGVVAGREFTPGDTERGSPVVVVNETFARRYFSGQDPVGRVVTIVEGRERGQPRQIVGVVRDARYNDLRREIRPMFYAPLTQLPRRVQSVEVQIDDGASPVVVVGASVRAAIADAAPDWIVEDVRTIAQQIDRPIATERFIGRVAIVVGTLALGLAAVGLYGLLSFLVARRTADIGIRRALGASAAEVLQPIVGRAVVIVAGGVLAGLALAVAATRVVSRFLFGLTATDPWTMALVAAVVTAAGAAAAYVPARRATRVDPVIALRSE